MVTQVALFVALVVTVLAVIRLYSLLKAVKVRLYKLEHPDVPPNPARFTPAPEVIQSVFLPETVPEMDVVGAWALEEERAGRPVSEETLVMQRRMWLEA